MIMFFFFRGERMKNIGSFWTKHSYLFVIVFTCFVSSTYLLRHLTCVGEIFLLRVATFSSENEIFLALVLVYKLSRKISFARCLCHRRLTITGEGEIMCTFMWCRAKQEKELQAHKSQEMISETNTHSFEN